MNSSGVLAPIRAPETRLSALRCLAGELDRLARRHQRIVLTGEGLSQIFWERDRPVLAALNSLSESHAVRIAYYVRPQHTALEAAWRQWGFRAGLSPAQYLSARAHRLHYLDTLVGVQAHAPGVDFRMRPFREDLLVGGDAVKDFAGQILGIDPLEVRGETADNVGIDLVLANLLSSVPAGVLWESPHDNRSLSTLKNVFRGLETDDERAGHGRRVLQRWAHSLFSEENRELFRVMDWDTGQWLPDIEAQSGDLELLDELWTPSASSAELACIHRLLEHVVVGPPRHPAWPGSPRSERFARRYGSRAVLPGSVRPLLGSVVASMACRARRPARGSRA